MLRFSTVCVVHRVTKNNSSQDDGTSNTDTIQSRAVGIQLPLSHVDWSLTYQLPAFPPAVANALSQSTSLSMNGKNSCRAALIQCLFDSMTVFTWYVTLLVLNCQGNLCLFANNGDTDFLYKLFIIT